MDATTRSCPTATLVVVVERDIVIAHDLCEMLQDNDPGADVRICRSLAEARDAILDHDRIKALLTSASPAEIARAGIETLVFSRGGHIVVMSGAETADLSSDSRWIFAQRILSPTVVAAIMRKTEKRAPPDLGG